MIARGRRRSFQRRVLDWYAAHGRDLPWRRTRDPYAILVSEVLSHQTQIARVLPVYERLLGRYPTVTALASAPQLRIPAKRFSLVVGQRSLGIGSRDHAQQLPLSGGDQAVGLDIVVPHRLEQLLERHIRPEGLRAGPHHLLGRRLRVATELRLSQ